jgi:hypothetical protein
MMDAENFALALKKPDDKSIREVQVTTDSEEHYSYARRLNEEDKKELQKDEKDRKDYRVPPINLVWSRDSKKIGCIRQDERKAASRSSPTGLKTRPCSLPRHPVGPSTGNVTIRLRPSGAVKRDSAGTAGYHPDNLCLMRLSKAGSGDSRALEIPRDVRVVCPMSGIGQMDAKIGIRVEAGYSVNSTPPSWGWKRPGSWR